MEKSTGTGCGKGRDSPSDMLSRGRIEVKEGDESRSGSSIHVVGRDSQELTTYVPLYSIVISTP